MLLPVMEINEKSLAEYTSLLRYTSAWRTLDVEILKEIFDPKVEFDAPGIPFDIVGRDKVLGHIRYSSTICEIQMNSFWKLMQIV